LQTKLIINGALVPGEFLTKPLGVKRPDVPTIYRFLIGRILQTGHLLTRSEVVKTKFGVFDVLMIAEDIEHRRAKFYVQGALLFEAGRQRYLCYKLANWSVRHEKFWAEKRRQHRDG
jgi:hypothetical protein